MPEPTCINCNRRARVCKEFEGRDCYAARAAYFERKYHQLRQGALLAVREGRVELLSDDTAAIEDASANDGQSDRLALVGFFRSVADAVGDTPANAYERLEMNIAATEARNG